MYYQEFSKPKQLIFEKAIDLFSQYSYETVALNDISSAIGKRKSGIYNHFKSKQEILDTIYDFFCHHFFDGRPTVDQMDPLIESGSIAEIISAINFTFPETTDQLMQKIMRIIHQQKFHSDQARQIVKDIMIDQSIEYVCGVFNRAVEIGRFAPFDTRSLAVLCTNLRQSIYSRWLLVPTKEYYQILVEEEQRLYGYAASLITDLRKEEMQKEH